jgi:hypothetical protein
VTALLGLLLFAAVPAAADVYWGGFLQGLYGGRIDSDNPTETEQTASESRLQLRLEHFGDGAEVFARMDFFYDGAVLADYDWELREGYLKFRLGSKIDVKMGRQVLTWGTGDLIFINDVFAKDYRSFFIGRDDQYLKAPQDAVRIEWYNPAGALSLVWTPRFEPNRLPMGQRLSYFSPFAGQIVGTGMGENFLFDPPIPEARFKNGEFATRLQRRVGNFALAAYFYHGFYKNPLGAKMVTMGTETFPVPFYPRLDLYGASARGTFGGGILWLEGGYYDSRDDEDNDNPLVPNSSVTGLAGFERQVATNLTANVQWQIDRILDFDKYEAGQQAMNAHVRDEWRHLLTTRWTKRLHNELVTLSGFLFYSPTDQDAYLRFSAAYKYTDQLELAAGGNMFFADVSATEFGQFDLNDNVFLKVTYGF